MILARHKQLQPMAIFKKWIQYRSSGYVKWIHLFRRIDTWICNGFQLLVKLGLLPGLGEKKFVRQVSLAPNKSAKYEDRWLIWKLIQIANVFLHKTCLPWKCLFAMAKGRLVAENQQTPWKTLTSENLDRFNPYKASILSNQPWNILIIQNGSVGGIAGLLPILQDTFSVSSPHPEAFHHFGNHPKWTRASLILQELLFLQML